MHIIPVIDVLNGVVVHAKKGARQHYQPIQSSLCDSQTPLDIVRALLANYVFSQLYIADLNAIQKLNGTYTTNYACTTNYEIVKSIQQHFPQLTLWLDAGVSNQTELAIWQSLNVRLVIGSENFANISNYAALPHANKPFVLSLDFFATGYQGPAELLENTAYWPQDVIVMSLANVGTNEGANEALMQKILQRAKGKHIYAAGGVRGLDDLKQLKKMGVSGALMATALHQQQISREALNSLSE